MASLSPMMLTYLASAFLLYCVALGIYRLYFSPLANFPGPRLAAMTLWYEFYYDVICKGRFVWKIRELHEQYGPIIRINPHEIHISDPDFYDEIYTAGSRKRDKYYWFMRSFGPGGSMVNTIDHDFHRRRRAAMGSFFSKRSIQALEPSIKGKVDQLTSRFTDLAKSGEVVSLSAAYAGLTMDVISGYCFGESMGCLKKESFGQYYLDFFHDGPQIHPWARQFPWFQAALFRLPISTIGFLNPGVKTFLQFNESIRPQIRRILSEEKSDVQSAQRTIFHEVKDSNLPPSEKTEQRLTDEASIFLGAGTETTARALAFTSYQLIQNPQILDKLRKELKSVMPRTDSAVPVSTLEQLPYLSAVIAEGLRLSFGVTARLPRIATHEDLRYSEWVIPRGTPVSSAGYIIHTDKTVFPDPFKFEPERWLGEIRLDKYLVAFTKGNRACIGMNLAYSELYLGLACVFRRFDIALFETTKRDVEIVHDFFIGQVETDSKGIRAKIVGEMKD